MSQLDYDNVVIAEVQVLYRETAAEWELENPVIGLGYGAYSKDTRLIRVGDGVHTWSELKDIDPVKYVGPHAYSHMPGGNDEIIITADQMPHTPSGTVLFGTGVGATDRPISKYTLYQAYVCENSSEVNVVKEVASDQENIFNTWERYSHSTLGDHYENDKLIYTCTDEDKGYPAETKNWYYDATKNRIRNTTNSYTPIGLVSPHKYTDYTFESTLIISDDDFDDDSIGVVLAYAEDSSGKNHTLTVLRSIGGNRPYTIYYNHGKSSASLIRDNYPTVKWGTGYYGTDAADAKYWTSTSLNGNRTLRTYLFRSGVKIKIVRSGNVFTIMTSNFTNPSGIVTASKYMYPNTTEVLTNVSFNCDTSTDVLEETKMVLDLDNFTLSYYNVTYNDDKTEIVDKTWVTSTLSEAHKEKLTNLKVPGSMGYCCCSHKNTTWNNISFISPGTKIYNATTDVVEIPSGANYVVDSNSSLYKDFNPQGVFLYNDITQKLFYLYDNKLVSLVSGNGSSSGSSTVVNSVPNFYLLATEVGNTVGVVDEYTTIPFTTTESSHGYFADDGLGTFTYVNDRARKISITVQQRYVREDQDDVSTAYNIDTRILTDIEGTTSVSYRYGVMSLGIPYVDVVTTMIHTFIPEETFTVSFKPSVETRTFNSSDDPGVLVSDVSNLILRTID